jgi:hypothetical protein
MSIGAGAFAAIALRLKTGRGLPTLYYDIVNAYAYALESAERLRGEHVELASWNIELRASLDRQRAEAERLRGELELQRDRNDRLREDALRLDWLEGHALWVERKDIDSSNELLTISARVRHESREALLVREALDDARAAGGEQ